MSLLTGRESQRSHDLRPGGGSASCIWSIVMTDQLIVSLGAVPIPVMDCGLIGLNFQKTAYPPLPGHISHSETDTLQTRKQRPSLCESVCFKAAQTLLSLDDKRGKGHSMLLALSYELHR